MANILENQEQLVANNTSLREELLSMVRELPEAGSDNAEEIIYDNTSSGLNATTVKEAIDELQTSKAPMYTYGTTDIGSGVEMEGPEGSIYFVIE